MSDELRLASLEDAVACADILNAWIDRTDWMPRIHLAEDVARHYHEFVLPTRRVCVVGKPVQGYLALDVQNAFVTSLYAARPGNGVGKRLLDEAKTVLPSLNLWTFVANEDARRFYEREGFEVFDQSDGENDEGLPDVMYRWTRWPVRRAVVADALHCARIVSGWVSRTSWIEERFSFDEFVSMFEAGIPMRELYLVGEVPEGYLSLDAENNLIAGLYTEAPGRGRGKVLLDQVKLGRDYLQLWTHAPNTAAHRFYEREGFVFSGARRDGDDGLPELHMEWRRGA